MSNQVYYLNRLQKSPGHKQVFPNSWADYVELVCLANIDNETSQEDIVNRLAERVKDLKEDADDSLQELEELEKEQEEDIEPSRRAEISDKWDTRVKDYFKILALRQSLYKDYYPFIINDDCINRKDNLSDNHFLYIYLLLCSNLYLFEDETRSELANTFELISFNAFKSFLPLNAEIHLFGKNPYNKRGRYSSGDFWKKLNKLIKDINEKRNPHVKRTEFSVHHTGDEGLDLVGWIPTNDNLSSALICFAQCACTYNFVEKQHSSSYIAWKQKLVFKNPPSNSTFIPHCFRKSDGTWVKSTYIMDTFLVDRKRILNYYSDSKKIKFSSLSIYNLVKNVLALKEPVV